MIELGKMNKLKILEVIDSGYYLEDGDKSEEVFLPHSMSMNRYQVGDEVEVFAYLATNGEQIATDQKPYAVVDEYAYMKVVEVQEFGAFFDWGIKKDLLVPGNEQKIKVREGEFHLVRLCLEQETKRVFGTTKLGAYIQNSDFNIKDADKVKVVPVEETDLGYRCIINRKFVGMIYHNEIFKPIEYDKEVDGVVKKIREDGLVDCALQIQGIKNLDQSAVTILKTLKDNGGSLALHDKSSPEEIKRALHMSKKTFKSAIGMLYKRKKIIISNKGIELV